MNDKITVICIVIIQYFSRALQFYCYKNVLNILNENKIFLFYCT